MQNCRKKYNGLYAKLEQEGYSTEEIDRTKLAYLLGAVDALRVFCGFDVPEVEFFYILLGDRKGDLAGCLSSLFSQKQKLA